MKGTWKALSAVWLLLSAVGFAVSDGTVTGRVQDAAGKPQMGATVEVYAASTMPVTRAYTDAKGAYTLKGLLPGTYFIKASAAQFLPTVREGVTIKAGAHLLVNLTLTTLIEAFQLLPSRRVDAQGDDDWRWTLRSSANRPILRVLEDSGIVVVSRSERREGDLKGQLAFLAGSDGSDISGSDVTTNFRLEHSMFNAGTVSFTGRLGSMDGQANGALRASYKHRLGNGNEPEFSVALRRFASADLLTHHAGVGALSLGIVDHSALSDFLEADYGGELQTVQFRGRTTAFKPFVVLTAHTGENMTVQYRYATSRPNPRAETGFESWASEITLADPRVSMLGGVSKIERSRHHEIAVSRRFGNNNFQVAAFSDSLRDPSLLGVGDVVFADDELVSANFLPDTYSGTFNFTGRNFSSTGARAVAQHQWKNMSATVDYSFGGALLAYARDIGVNFNERNLHAATAKIAGKVPLSGTRWMASYKWTSDPHAVTAVDLFNDSAGRSDPFLNVFIRQHIPNGFMPGKMEALVDVRNLLAQGYVPFVSPDGRTIYLVQSARSLRGGVAFNF